jgi:Pyridoxamine 5'-phosphate oxidase
MTSWNDFAGEEPALAGRVRDLFSAHRHHTMATLRKDGSPRISGTEVSFEEGEMTIGIMAGAVRAGDLRRDPRIAIHSHSIDPPEGDQSGWPGEAKVAGMAIEVAADGDHHAIRIDIEEVVLTGLGTPPDHLAIETWHPGRGAQRIRRY